MRRFAATTWENARSEDAVRRGKPLLAEESEERKLRYIEHRLGVGRQLAERIAANEDPTKLPLAPQQRMGAESLQGRTVDFLDVRFLGVGALAARSVARVADYSHRAIGTGFLVGPGLFLTNHHVLESPAEAARACVELQRELSVDGKALGPVTRFALDPGRLFVFDDTDDLDFALVAVGERVDGDGELEAFGWLPLVDADDKHILAGLVNVIQHPEGNPKQVVVRENRIFARTANTLIYGADTLPGSSGAPVFNDDWEVVALHHWGIPSRAKRDGDSTAGDLPGVGNEGIRVSAIVRELRSRLAGLGEEQRRLVHQAINPGFRSPSLAWAGGGSPRADPGVRRTEMANGPRYSCGGSGGEITFEVPLTVTVRLGAAAARAQPVVQETVDAGAEKLPAPDPDYSNRKGYNPKFLGVRVNLPTFTKTSLRNRRAKLLQPKPGEDAYELKYEHFSVVMHKERRLAIFTACNVDGGAVVGINRETGQVTRVEQEGAEAYERWYDDARIAATAQTDQKLYNHPEFKGVFHRGHLVKRTDPSWGTPERAIRGQSDTFHFTNCAPQHKNFNPNKSRWAGLEDWITKGSDDADLRVTVFTGCVFREDDPKFGYVQVPLDYWKVVAWVEDGRLVATAMLASHREGVEGGPDAEGMPSLPKKLPKEYQVPIGYVEGLTGLKFGKLAQFDVRGKESKPKPVEKFEDIKMRREWADTPEWLRIPIA